MLGSANEGARSCLDNGSCTESKNPSRKSSNPFDSDHETEDSEIGLKFEDDASAFGRENRAPDPFKDILKEKAYSSKQDEGEGVTDLLNLFDPVEVDTSSSLIIDLEFDTSRHFELFEDENSCPICFEIFCSKPPRIVVDCPKCNKSFCRGCLERIHKDKTNGTCPFCRQSFEWSEVSRNFKQERMVAHFPGFCSICNKQMARGELPEHEENCSEMSASLPTPEVVENSWACKQCTFKNHPDLLECEMCGGSVIPKEEMHLSTQSSFNHPVSTRLEGPVFVNVQSKVLFRKWKPMYFRLEQDCFELYAYDTTPSGNANPWRNTTPAQTFTLHPLMSFGPIYTVSDAKVIEKNTNRNKKIVRRTSHHKRLYRVKLFQYAGDSAEYSPVLDIAMGDCNRLKQLIRGFTTASDMTEHSGR